MANHIKKMEESMNSVKKLINASGGKLEVRCASVSLFVAEVGGDGSGRMTEKIAEKIKGMKHE